MVKGLGFRVWLIEDRGYDVVCAGDYSDYSNNKNQENKTDTKCCYEDSLTHEYGRKAEDIILD